MAVGVIVVMVPVGMVVRMIMVMSMMMGTRRMNGLEHLLNLGIRDFQTVQHLADRRVILDQKIILAELGSKMQVADLPCIVRSLLRSLVGHAENHLRLLFERIHLPVNSVERLAMAQRVLQIEAEFTAISSSSSPTALGQGATVDDELDGF